MAEPARRAFPALSEANKHFWCGGADGQLHILRCGKCGHWVHPYAGRCTACHKPGLTPQPVSGLGTVTGFTVNHQQWVPGLEVPYVVAVVTLDEQADLRLMTNMPRTPVDAVHIGMKVRVFFEQHGDIHLPLFEAA